VKRRGRAPSARTVTPGVWRMDTIGIVFLDGHSPPGAGASVGDDGRRGGGRLCGKRRGRDYGDGGQGLSLARRRTRHGQRTLGRHGWTELGAQHPRERAPTKTEQEYSKSKGELNSGTGGTSDRTKDLNPTNNESSGPEAKGGDRQAHTPVQTSS
jgi:hypothetical protein